MFVLKFYFQPDSKFSLLLFDSKFLNFIFTTLFVISIFFFYVIVVWSCDNMKF